MRSRASLMCLLVALLAACSNETHQVPATALIVRLTSAPELQTSLQRVRLRTAGAQGQAWTLRTERAYQAGELEWPVDLVLVPSGDWTPERNLEIIVDALDAADKPLVQARVLTSFLTRQTRIVSVNLVRCGAMAIGQLCEPNLDCYGPNCRTCVAGACQATPLTAAQDLPALIPMAEPISTPDASNEAGLPGTRVDASLDAGPSPLDAAVQAEAGAGDGGVDASPIAIDGNVVMPTPEAGTGGQPDAAACISTTELCDGKDNDCDGEIDDQVKIRCWADADGDGFAAQNAAIVDSCDQCGAKQTATAPGSGKVDCDDNDAKKSPGATDLCGDAIDNDCDGMTDEEANNACNGPCTTRLPGRPNDACSNGLKGACARTGVYECLADHSMRCTAMSVTGSAETCGDNSDNDCDGVVDNGCVRNACGGWSKLANAKGASCSAGSGSCAASGTYQCQGTDATVCNATPLTARTWYRDCDRDTFAASFTGQMDACAKPALASGCDWTVTPPTGSNVDCDDDREPRHPGAGYGLTPAGASPDLDCNGVTSQKLEFVASNDARYGASNTYNICSKPLDQLTSSSCNCWYVSTVMWGFTRFTLDGPQSTGHTIPWLGGPSGVEPAPCAEAVDNVGIALLVSWDASSSLCYAVTNVTAALRTMCK